MPKKKVEMGRWRARCLRRRWRWGGGGMLKQLELELERGKQQFHSGFFDQIESLKEHNLAQI